MDLIKVIKDKAVTRIVLNRPKAMNALTSAMHHRLHEIFDDFSDDDTQRIAVITGAGEKAFCAGSDLIEGLGAAYPPSGYAGLSERKDLRKPVIAAVNGFALGGGFELALVCDLIIAAENASFGLPEPLVGAVALGGGLHRLPRQIGLKPAMDMILTSRRLTAQEGQRLGFVNKVVPADELENCVRSYCDMILKGAPLAIEASKMTVMRGLGESSTHAALSQQSEYPEFIKWQQSADFKEGLSAFSEKREPIWSGR